MRKSRYLFLVLAALACLLVGGCGDDPAPVAKSNGKFLYVNNNAAANFVSAFTINADGTLVEITGSPFTTAGVGSGGGYFAANPIALARTKKVLYAANKGDDTISAFSIDATTGVLTAIGTPVASGATQGSSGSLVVNAAETFLFVANDASNSISVFAIAADGTLTAVTGSPFALGAFTDGITMNLVGSTMYVADPQTNQLVVLAVAADGSLTPITGSPFPYVPINGDPIDPDSITSFTLASATLGIAGATSGVISSYLLDATGAPTLVESQLLGINAQCVTTARDGSLAILSGGFESSIYVVSLAASGAMTAVTGSPFTTIAPTSGYAVANPKGTLIYATEVDQIEAFTIATDGALTSIASYPLTSPGFATGAVIYY
jgi:6-phosphogluconolactonase (cycloisomerase 2 family)